MTPSASSADWRGSLSDSLPTAVVVAGVDDGVVLYANRRFGALLSIAAEHARGETLDELLGAPGSFAMLLEAAEGERGDEVEIHGRCPDGSELWLIGHSCREHADGQGSVLVSTLLDGSPRRRLESDVVALAELPERNPGPVCRLDEVGTVMLANAAARSLFPTADLIGSSWLDVCPGVDSDLWAQVLASDAPFLHEARLGPVTVLFTHVHSAPGESVFAFGADISDRRDAEQRLAKQAEQLAELARFPDMNPGPVIRTDLGGTVMMDNKAARRVLGDGLVGRSWLEICPGLDEETWKRIVAAPEPVPLEGVIGDHVYVFTHRADPKNELLFVYGADVTVQRQTERALRQSERMATLGTLVAGVAHELNNPAAATSRAAEQLREALAKLENAHLGLDTAGLPADALSHLQEIEARAREQAGSPGELDALTRSDLEAAVEQWLDERGIDDAWELAPSLVAQSLDVAELERVAAALPDDALQPVLRWAASTFPVHALAYEIGEGSTRISELVHALKSYSFLGQAPLQAIDIHEGLDNTLVILRSKLKRGISVQRDYCTDMPLVPAFGSELNQVWTNLIDNAVDAMSGQGKLTIRTRHVDGWATIEVEDEGPGIPADLQEQVFDPFFTTKDPGRGTGLGLATSYSVIVEKHGGALTVESRPGRTVFTVRLPAEASPLAADAAEPGPAMAETTQSSRRYA